MPRTIQHFVFLTALAMMLAIPLPVAGQSDDDPSVATDTAAETQDEAPAPEVAPQPAPVPQIGAPSYVTNAVYLRRLEQVRTGWYTVEDDFYGMVRQMRLGTARPTVVAAAGRNYERILANMDVRLASASPPAQFMEVHQFHLAANSEIHAAAGAASRWLTGNDSAFADADAHFANFDWYIGRAVEELG